MLRPIIAIVLIMHGIGHVMGFWKPGLQLDA